MEQRRTSSKVFTIYVQYIQIYNEKVYDLLNTKRSKNISQEKGLKIKLNPVTDEVHIQNVYVFECTDFREALGYFHKGLKNKVMSAHNLNNSSSRSHCILTFTVYQQDKSQKDSQIVSKLQLVDLAGSERQSHTHGGRTPDPKAFKEAVEINKSLFTLRQVISALTENASNKKDLHYVPYRESKLTTILKQSLGGNSFTLMIACLSPLDMFIDENISTLNYAAKAKLIKNVPTINIDPKIQTI